MTTCFVCQNLSWSGHSHPVLLVCFTSCFAIISHPPPLHPSTPNVPNFDREIMMSLTLVSTLSFWIPTGLSNNAKCIHLNTLRSADNLCKMQCSEHPQGYWLLKNAECSVLNTHKDIDSWKMQNAVFWTPTEMLMMQANCIVLNTHRGVDPWLRQHRAPWTPKMFQDSPPSISSILLVHFLSSDYSPSLWAMWMAHVIRCSHCVCMTCLQWPKYKIERSVSSQCSLYTPVANDQSCIALHVVLVASGQCSLYTPVANDQSCIALHVMLVASGQCSPVCTHGWWWWLFPHMQGFGENVWQFIPCLHLLWD